MSGYQVKTSLLSQLNTPRHEVNLPSRDVRQSLTRHGGGLLWGAIQFYDGLVYIGNSESDWDPLVASFKQLFDVFPTVLLRENSHAGRCGVETPSSIGLPMASWLIDHGPGIGA